MQSNELHPILDPNKVTTFLSSDSIKALEEHPIIDNPNQKLKLTATAVDGLLNTISQLSLTDREELVQLLYFPESSATFELEDANFGRATGLYLIPSQNLRLTVLGNRRVTEVLKPQLIKALEDPVNNTLNVKRLEQLVENQSILFEKYRVNNDEVLIVDPYAINQLTAWYTDRNFRHLDNFLNQNPSNEAVQRLMIFGVLFDKFRQSDLQAEQYRALLRQYITPDTPAVVRDAILFGQKENKNNRHVYDSDRLHTLKSFWGTTFLNALVAQAQLSDHKLITFSAEDQQIMATLPKDDRLHTSQGEAFRADRLAALRTGSYALGNDNQQRYQATTSIMERRVSSKKRQAANLLSPVAKAYNPPLSTQLALAKYDVYITEHSQERLRTQWKPFAQFSPEVLPIFIQAMEGIAHDKSARQNSPNVLAQLVLDLRTVFAQRKRAQAPEELFGSNFHQLSDLEKIALIIFPSITLTSVKNSTYYRAIELVSTVFQPLLARVHDQVPALPTTDTDPSLFDPVIDDTIGPAIRRLDSLSLEHGVISVRNRTFQHELATKERVAIEINKVIEEFSNIPEERYEKYASIDLFINILLYAILFFTSVGIVNEAPAAIHTAISAMLLSFSSLNAPRAYMGKKEAQLEFTQLRILHYDFVEQVEKLRGRIDERIRAKLLRVLGISLIAATAGFGVGNFFEQGVSPSSQIELPDVLMAVIDNIRPEALDKAALAMQPYIHRGNVESYPESLGSEFSFEGVFLPTKIIDVNGGEYKQQLQPFIPQEPLKESTYVYTLTNHVGPIYPLDGYRIIRVEYPYQVELSIDSLGTIYSSRQDRADVKIFVEKRPVVSEILASETYEGIVGERYSPWENWPELKRTALELNAQLAGDYQLQKIHGEMIHEVDSLVTRFNNSELTEPQLRQQFAHLVQRYDGLFSVYMYGRHYGLRMQLPLDGNYLTLLSRYPYEGVFCTIANEAFKEFFASIGVKVLLKEGAFILQEQDQLLIRINHVESLVLNVDETVIDGDKTPYLPMPGEDLSALDRKPISNPFGAEQPGFPSEVAISAVITAAFLGRKRIGKQVKNMQWRLPKTKRNLPSQSTDFSQRQDVLTFLPPQKFERIDIAQQPERQIVDHDVVINVLYDVVVMCHTFSSEKSWQEFAKTHLHLPRAEVTLQLAEASIKKLDSSDVFPTNSDVVKKSIEEYIHQERSRKEHQAFREMILEVRRAFAERAKYIDDNQKLQAAIDYLSQLLQDLKR